MHDIVYNLCLKGILLNMIISLSEYAKKHSKSCDTIRRLVENGKFKSAYKIGRNWVIDSDENYPVRKRRTKNVLNVLSLFSGCGGMDLGFEGGFEVFKEAINPNLSKDWNIQSGRDENWVYLPKTKFQTIFANDIREDAKMAWTNYFGSRNTPPSVYNIGSIVDFVKAHKEGKYLFPKHVDVITGGFPCQDFSVAGKRQGFQSKKSHDGTKLSNDTPSIESRGQLYMWMREVVSIVQPRIFIAENVKGLINLSDVKEIIENDFRSISKNGYLVVEAKVLHAADYGVPQSRERVIFIGFKKSELTEQAIIELSNVDISEKYNPYPPKTHSYTTKGKQLSKHTTTRQAFVGLNEPELSDDNAQKVFSKAKYMGSHVQGQTEINLDGIAPTIRSEHHGNIEFRRLSKLHGGKNNEELQQGLKERRLTVRECARIQTFPDDYQFVFRNELSGKNLSSSNAYKLIGNAVPPLLAYHIAKRIEKNWELYFGGNKK